jgi:cation:H+ antiporter
LLPTLVLLAASAAVIYIACEAFVNGVEWLGHRWNLTQTATGTVLAAFGTALPESVVTLVAAAFGSTSAQKDIAVGAALGGPLALSTVAYGVVAAMMLLGARRRDAQRDPALQADTRRLRRDQLWFLAVFVFKVGLGLVAFAWKPWLGWVFLAIYAIYTMNELGAAGDRDDAADLEPLKVRPRDPAPAAGWAFAQTLGAVVVIFVASHVFVVQLEALGPQIGMPPDLVALLFSPIATELPETLNAVIWVRQGKERLALANISGAMMIQATVPTAFGLFWTPWRLQEPLLVAAAVTMAAILYLQWIFRRPAVHARALSRVAWLYAAFAAIILMRA